jgi:CO dehydrogenase/acetyl-CoA synthase beta subunit
MQKKTIEKNVHFEEMTREFKNIIKRKLKIIEHVNVIILQK